MLLTKNPDLWGRHHGEGSSQGPEGSSRDRHASEEKSPPFRANASGRDDRDGCDDGSPPLFQTGLADENDAAITGDEVEYEEFVL